MLKKAMTLCPLPFNKWREITIGTYSYYHDGGEYGYSYTTYLYGISDEGNLYAPSTYGSISDWYINDVKMTYLSSFHHSTGRVDDYTEIRFVGSQYISENTVYLQVEGRDLCTLSKERGEGYTWKRWDWVYFNEDDVGKTMKIYLGTTPPLREKLRELFGLGGFSYAEQGDASLCRRNTRNGLVCRRRKLDSRESSMLWEQLQSWKNYFLQWGPQSFFDSNIYEKHFHCQNIQRCRQNCDGVLHSCVAYNRTSILGGAVC